MRVFALLLSLLMLVAPRATAAPIILVPPLDLTLGLGSDARFTVVAAGLIPLSYRWYHGTNLLAGETGSSLLVPQISAEDRGRYTVEVRDATGTSASSSVNLTIPGLIDALLPPLFAEQPQSAVSVAGGDVHFTAKVEGTEPISYQWLFNGAPIPGATNRDHALYYTRLAEAGVYVLVASNQFGVAVSANANLTVDLAILPFADDFGLGGVLSGTYYAGIGSVVDATRQAGEPRHDFKRTDRTMWFSWTAPTNGIARFSTANSDFDTVLAIYTGQTVDTLVRVESDDDSGPTNTSALRFNAQAGVTYHVAIAGYGIERGTAVLEFDLTATADLLPAFLKHPRSVSVLPGSRVTMDVAFTNNTPSDLNVSWWFRGGMLASSASATNDVPSVSDEFVGTYRARIVTPTHTVYSRPADLQINSRGLPEVFARDKLVDAAEAGLYDRAGVPNSAAKGRTAAAGSAKSGGAGSRGFSATQIFSTFGANSDPGEPVHCSIAAGRSEWFAYQAETNGTLRIDTDGSNFDTVLAVYVGPGDSYATLTNIACDNDSGIDGKDSMVRFQAVKGTIYYIAVDGVSNASPQTGLVKLHINLGNPVTVAAHPQSMTVPTGTNVAFTAAADGMTNYLFQWRFNGVPLPGATNDTLVRSNVNAAHVGGYDVLIGNPINSTTTAVATLTVLSSTLVITNQPVSQTATQGSLAQFSVGASGSGTLRYQWMKNGNPLTGATNAALSLASVNSGDAGTYAVVVQDANGIQQSATASLTVLVPPLITLHPVSQTVSPGANIVLQGAATGVPSPSLQWYFNGAPVAGAISATLSVSDFQAASQGNYTLRASNTVGIAESAIADLLLNTALRVTNVFRGSNYAVMRIIGAGNTNHILQASSNLVNWASLTTNHSGLGIWSYSETNESAPIRFYRVVQP